MIICPENAKLNSEVDFWSKFPMEFLEKIFAEILQMQIKEFCNCFVIFSLKYCRSDFFRLWSLDNVKPEFRKYGLSMFSGIVLSLFIWWVKRMSNMHVTHLEWVTIFLRLIISVKSQLATSRTHFKSSTINFSFKLLLKVAEQLQN